MKNRICVPLDFVSIAFCLFFALSLIPADLTKLKKKKIDLMEINYHFSNIFLMVIAHGNAESHKGSWIYAFYQNVWSIPTEASETS